MVTNISCYRFTPLTGLKELRARLLDQCHAAGLKGTILLAPEGINMFLAGPRAAIDALVDTLRTLPGLADLAPKYSESEHQPFNRMLVRLKKEIIAFGIDGIDPAQRTSPKLPAATLKQWLDEGRPITLLDTRNDYEVKLGTFRGAKDLRIDHFREFPAASRRLPDELKSQPVVMFCTGGIRCEKAGPFLEREGFSTVYQLDGGILKYFEEVGHDHYDGECFVFDQRVGVDPALRETPSVQCFNCQTPLNADEQAHPHYQPPHHCPHCYRSPDETRAELLARRNAAFRAVTHPLPALVPYENRRPIRIAATHDGLTLAATLAQIFPHVDAAHWAATFAADRWRDADDRPVTADQPVRPGEFYWQLHPATTEPPVATDIRVLHEDDALIVLHKPAPLPMHPSGRYNRHTLEYFLRQVYAPHRPRPAHRLDANTTGLVVCARTGHLAGRLQPQFTRGEVDKVYLARVHGRPAAGTFACDAPITDEPETSGARRTTVPGSGKSAHTTFHVIAYRESDDTTLLEAEPATGRTNQIRVHLQHLGHPIVGDPIYGAAPPSGLPTAALGAPTATLPVDAPPLHLHCARLTFTHPTANQRVTFEGPRPPWA